MVVDMGRPVISQSSSFFRTIPRIDKRVHPHDIKVSSRFYDRSYSKNLILGLLRRIKNARFSWASIVPRFCFSLITIMALFIGLSLFLGLFFASNKSYGYSMGDAFFTLASYIVTVGGLICGFLFACHFPRCKCWTSATEREESMRGVYKLQGSEIAVP